MTLQTRPRVLVTGASGFVGRRVVQRFASEGFPVVAVSRSPARLLPAGAVGAIIPELSGETSWRDLVRGVGVVIHCAAHVPGVGERPEATDARYQRVNVEGTQALAKQAAEAGVRRFLFLSSIKIHGESTSPGQPFDERSPIAPADAYGRSKAAAEAALQRVVSTTAMESVVVRPPLVYGAGAKGNLAALMHWIRCGLPLPLGAVHGNRRSLIAVENLVDSIRHGADHPGAAGQTFIVSDGEDLSTTALLRALGRVVGRSALLVPVPPGLLRATATLVGQSASAMRLLGSLQVDSSHFRKATGWHPPLTVEEGLRRMAVPQ